MPSSSAALKMGGRISVGLVSLLVFGASGYSWAQWSRLNDGLVTADVIAPSAQAPTGAQALSVDQNILLVGLDARTDAQGDPLPQDVLDRLHAGSASDGGDTTDTMIVVHIPAGGGRATAISIPRDSYVDIAGGYGKHKINSAFTYGKQAATRALGAQGVTGADLARQSDAAGARTTIQTVEEVTGLAINHYAAVNLVGFYSLSEAVGGVQVCLKAPVNDPYSGADFPAGPQALSGEQALAFVRQRHGLPNGDLDRIARQQALLSSMARTVLGAGTLTDSSKLSALIDAIQGAVVIDRRWNVLEFAEQMRGLTSGDIGFVTIPVQSLALPTPSDGDAVKVDPAQVQAFVANVTAGGNGLPATPPRQAMPTGASSSEPATGPSGVRENVKLRSVARTAHSRTPTGTPTPTPIPAPPGVPGSDLDQPVVTDAAGCVD